MAPRSPRRGSSRPASGKPRRGKQIATTAPEDPLPAGVEDIAVRAARLGITVERVLLEYAAIAFADLRHIVELEPGGGGFRVRSLSEMTDADVAAISEIVPGTDPEHPRIKLYDRKAALDAIARHLGMFPAAVRRREEPPAEEEEEDPREFLARELARLAAAAAEE